MSPVRVFCLTCRRHHDGDVVLDPTGWPTVRWSDSHDPDAVALQDHLAAVARKGGKALALVLDAGDWAKVEEVLSAVLELNDKPEEGAAES